MGTHFHAVVTTPHGNLSEFMRQFEGDFARYQTGATGEWVTSFKARFGAY